jgi:hypothetical protein
MAYVVQFDVDAERIEEALSSKLHIISIDSASVPSRDQALAALFDDIQRQLDTKASANLRNSRPDLFESVEPVLLQKTTQSADQSPVIETTSRLCFVMMPFSDRFDEIYRLVIAPAVEESGLTVLRADELATPGFIVEQIRTAIQQSRICIADLTGHNANVMYEIGLAHAAGKPLIMLADQGTLLPFDISHQRVILYGNDLETAKLNVQRALSNVLSEDRLEEAGRLFEIGAYRSAIAASAVVLEHRLREAVGGRVGGRHVSLRELLKTAQQKRIVNKRLSLQLAEVITLRNRAVHEIGEPTKEQAELVLATIRDAIATLSKGA